MMDYIYSGVKVDTSPLSARYSNTHMQASPKMPGILLVLATLTAVVIIIFCHCPLSPVAL